MTKKTSSSPPPPPPFPRNDHKIFRCSLLQTHDSRQELASTIHILIHPYPFLSLESRLKVFSYKRHIYEQSLRCALLAHTCRTRRAGTERRAGSVLLLRTWPRDPGCHGLSIRLYRGSLPKRKACLKSLMYSLVWA